MTKLGRPRSVAPEGYVTVAVAAQMLGVTTPRIYQMIGAKELAYKETGENVFIEEKQLSAENRALKLPAWLVQLRASAQGDEEQLQEAIKNHFDGAVSDNVAKVLTLLCRPEGLQALAEIVSEELELAVPKKPAKVVRHSDDGTYLGRK